MILKAKLLASLLGSHAGGETATKRDLSETELRLQKEIADVRKEIKEMDSRLTKEIAMMGKEMKEMDTRLIKEIKELEVRQSQLILNSKSESLRWVIGAMFANTGLIVTLLKVLG
ncbi:MAG: hypothetical protein KDK36_05790 [Leptospiraceae bacterium]|nr:hypothetical protein [Leptospiraceae bacterium]